MLWLTWNMWILLLLAFLGGVVTGWIVRGKSDHAPKPLLDVKPQPASDQPAKEQAGSASETPRPVVEKEGSPPSEQQTDAAPSVEPEQTSSQNADDLTQIKGLGPKAAAKLNEMGVMRFGQIAEWSDGDIARVDEAIQGRGRIERDNWVGQAKMLKG